METIIKVPLRINPFFKRKQGFRFDMYCWVKYVEYNEIINDGKDEIDDKLFIRNILMFAAESYNKENGIKRMVNTSTVQYWIDNTYQRKLEPLLRTMMESRIGGTTIKEYVENFKTEEKKNSKQKV